MGSKNRRRDPDNPNEFFAYMPKLKVDLIIKGNSQKSIPISNIYLTDR